MNIPTDTIVTAIHPFLPILLALYSLFNAFYFLKKARVLENTPPSKIRSAAQGYVELLGRSTLLPNHPISSQFTQKPCVWYGYTVEQFQSNNNGWDIIEQGASFHPFLLTDETGACFVLPENAEIIPNATITWRGDSRTPSPPPTSFWTSLFWGHLGQFRYTESRLELDSALYLTGEFYTWQVNSAELNKYPELNLYAQDNHLDTVNVMVQITPKADEPYVISTLPERSLVRRFKIKSFLYFIGFLIFVAFATHPDLAWVQQDLRNWAFKMKSFHPASTWFLK